MTDAFPTLLASRRARSSGAGWSTARSWLGGAPRLGSVAWPRGGKGQPLHFAAQIDLAEVAAAAGDRRLPAHGSLAFFIGDGGAVRFIPEGEAGAPVMPPAGTPELSASGGDPDWPADLSGQPLFPYWPLDLRRLELGPLTSADPDEAYDEYIEAQAVAVYRHLPQREYSLSPAQAFEGPRIPDWWRTALYYAEYLDKAVQGAPGVMKREHDMLAYAHGKLNEAQTQGAEAIKKAEATVRMYEGRIAKLHEREPALHDFLAAVSDFSRGRDAWEIMSAEEMAVLAALWSRNREFDIFHFNSGAFPVDYLKQEMFKALPAAGSDAYAALPMRARDLIDARRAPRPIWWFAAIHFARRLRAATKEGVANAGKHRLEKIAAYRKRLPPQPKATLGVFGRKREPKSADELKLEAEIARVEAELAALEARVPMFTQFVREVSEWAKGRDPWARMGPEDIARLKTEMKRAQDEFGAFAGYIAPRRIEDLESLTLRAMATADDRGYAALPDAVREKINRDCLLPAGGWHQMFGMGVEIQGDSGAMRGEGYIMLLQLVHDDMMMWPFGDNGAYQFWISPSDLASRNWTGVKMTFECH